MPYFLIFLLSALSLTAQAKERIVSLSPHLTELVYAVGSGDQLVGVTRHSDYPLAAQQLPLVGDAFAVNLEAIQQLKPTLILLWKSGTPERLRDSVKALAKRIGAQVYDNEIRSVEHIATTLEDLGRLTQAQQQGQQAARDVRQRWQALQAKYSAASQPPNANKPLRVFYQVWDKPLMTFNGEHLVSQAIRLCGGVQGFDTVAALVPTISREAVLAFNPQIILTGNDGGKNLALAPWRTYKQLAAVQTGHLLQIDSIALTRMSPRFIVAATDLCERFDKVRQELKR